MALFFFLCTLISLSKSCTKIVVRSSNDDIDWLDATFLLDPTLVADGRPVYVEQLTDELASDPDTVQRSIYHYSHESSDDISQYVDKDFSGRWILGNSMYSANGWYYTESWAISPANLMMKSLANPPHILNPNKEAVHPKLQWRVHVKNHWQFDTTPHITLSCDTRFDDITYDWLFITTPNHYSFNILTTNDPKDHGQEMSSITESNLHGFFYRVSDEYWRKVESKLFFRKRALNDNDSEYSFLFYDEFTNEDGTPDVDKIKGYKVLTSGPSDGHLTDLNDNEWVVVDGDGRQYQAETVTVHIVTTEDDTDDIYSAYRRYWSDIKLKSFVKATKDWTEAQRNQVVVSQNNGLPFMMLGLGTGGLAERDAKAAMEYAINDVGYRVIDGAEAYENEVPLGEILSRKKVQRDEIFITSKVWPTHLGFIQTYQAILSSINKLKTNYFDLYMIHWNRCNPDISWMHCDQASNRPWGQTWQIMEKLYAEGYLLSIGISNYNFETFNEMLTSDIMQIVPQVLQNYFDISHADWELAQHVQGYGVIYQGYAQYRGIAEAEKRAVGGEKHYKLFKDKLEEISLASTGGKATPSQVLLQWLLQKEIAVIPRSKDVNHLKENWNIWDFELTLNDINELTQMSIEQNKLLQKGEL